MPYITCHRKKSRPKVNVDVCAQCVRKQKCAEYIDYTQPLLPLNLREKGLMRSVKRRAKAPIGKNDPAGDRSQGMVQLKLDLY